MLEHWRGIAEQHGLVSSLHPQAADLQADRETRHIGWFHKSHWEGHSAAYTIYLYGDECWNLLVGQADLVMLGVTSMLYRMKQTSCRKHWLSSLLYYYNLTGININFGCNFCCIEMMSPEEEKMDWKSINERSTNQLFMAELSKGCK